MRFIIKNITHNKMKKVTFRGYVTPEIQELNIMTEQVFATSGLDGYGGTHKGFTEGDWGSEDDYVNFN